MKKIFILFILILILIIPQLGCDSQTNNNVGIEKTSFHFDTVCKITIYSMEGLEDKKEDQQKEEALMLITDAFKLCDKYEDILSATRKGSDIYNINHAQGKAVKVSDETLEVISKGIEYGQLSDGNFDITIGAASRLWDFHQTDDEGEKSGKIPDDEKLKEAVTHVDYRNIKIEGNMVSLSDPLAELDLGGIAKGYIADKIADHLQAEGVTSAIISLGGNIVTVGEKGTDMTEGHGEAFSVGIADPTSDTGQLLGIVPCIDKTVVTSGTYERYIEADGKTYHHVLDPDTGYQFDTDLMSVTVIADRGKSADCDALSTICLSLGEEKGMEFIRTIEGVQAVFVNCEGDISLSSDDIDLRR